MAKTFKLKVLTPDGSVLDTVVEQIIVQTIDGEVGILPDHMPLITPLAHTPLKYWINGEIHFAAVLAGMMEVSKDGVTIITDHAALEVDIEKIIAQKETELEEAKKTQRKDTSTLLKAEMNLQSLLHNLRAVQELTRKIKK